MALIAVVFAGLVACDPNDRVDEPIGEAIWQEVGGFCGGACRRRSVYRDDRRLEYREHEGDRVTEQAFGDLAGAGLDEYTMASAELVALPQESLHTCSPVDGVDARVVLDDGERTFSLFYCVPPIDPPMERIHAFFEGVMQALGDCSGNGWVEPDC